MAEAALSCPKSLWQKLLLALRASGQDFSRESGAFLLGTVVGRTRCVSHFVLYDAIDPCCLDSGIVHFDGRYFGALWDLCRRRNLSVVSDVHTHPAGAWQSASDRNHPMITEAGHVAMILPRFAAAPVEHRAIGMYRYLGGKQWLAVADDDKHRFFRITANEEQP